VNVEIASASLTLRLLHWIQQWTTSLETRLNSAQFNPVRATQYIDNRLGILRALHQGSVAILLGSDAPRQFNVPGFSIHRPK
jgi:hypothetical protein